MNSHLDFSLRRSLELVTALRRATADFARREDELTRELTNRRSLQRRQHREALARVETARATQTAETSAAGAAAEARVRDSYATRRERIERVRLSLLKHLPKRAEEARGRWIGDLQLKQVQAERGRDQELKKAEKVFAENTAQLEVQRTAYTVAARAAHRAVEGFGTFKKRLAIAGQAAGAAADPAVALADLESRVSALRDAVTAFRGWFLTRVFGVLHLSGCIVLGGAIGVVVAVALGFSPAALRLGAGVAGVLIVAVTALFFYARRQAGPAADGLATALADALQAGTRAAAAVTARRESDHAKILAGFDRTCAEIRSKWNQADDVERDFRIRTQRKIDKQAPRATARNAELFRARLRRITPRRDEALTRIAEAAAARTSQLIAENEAESATLEADEATRWTVLASDWKTASGDLYADVAALNDSLESRFPAWSGEFVEQWQPPSAFTPVARFASLQVDLASDPAGLPKDPRLALPGAAQVVIPVALNFPGQGSLLFETPDSGEAAVAGTINNLILRILATTPPGKASFTIFDPVELGQNFAGLMHLSDYEDSLINRRIWTQRDQLEDRLAELSEHLEKVIQMYLRNEYATITEYNAQAGSVAEKYHFLVIADFPAQFSETAAKRLLSIAVSGPRCGVFTFIHWDPRAMLPDGFVIDELRKASVGLRKVDGRFVIAPEQVAAGAALVFDAPPRAELAAALVHKIGKSSIDSNRVEVPFAQIAPKPGELWQNDTTHELKIGIGRTGATKLQYLAIGKGTRQHALFAGKTGSGKSTLFHVIITNLALACSPEQVEFYLIDFKKGVEFKAYATARLPHARVVAIESDREFGLSVLQRVDEELKRRGDLFRRLGVQDVAGFKKAGALAKPEGGPEPMPRSLLIIDEFQEFFVEDDAIAQTASVLFDRIVRQGRAFGIHVLLGSQTLGGAFTLARATMGQMVIRVALQCNEADAYLIMDENNPAPRLLSRPGEGIYNDSAGALEGNSPFQVVWLSDDERDAQLARVRQLAEQGGKRPASPIVFEGNAPSDVRENDLLARSIESLPTTVPLAGRAWLGAPNSIKGPTEAVFHRQSGNHLLIVGQREEAALSMLGVALVALAAQHPLGAARFVLLHAATPGSGDEQFIERIAALVPHGVTMARGQDIATAVNEVAEELQRRTAGGASAAADPAIFVFVLGLQKFKKLRQEDDFDFSGGSGDGGPNAAAQFSDIVREGSTVGIHVLAAVDTFNSVGRFISRKLLSEFEWRVVFQMSANDSASLIDSPQAGNLGLHRALLHNEAQGSDETFRPYSPPDAAWLEDVAARFAARGAAV